jgi:RHS repeat-associated protein
LNALHQAGAVVRAFGLSFAVLASASLAQEVIPDFYKEPGLYPNRDYVAQHVNENIDPFTGALQIHSVDIHIPGNGGFDLKVVRSFNSTRINVLNPADLSTSSLAGMGWTVHFGRVLKNRNTSICQNTDGGIAIGDNPVIELPDGSRQILAFTGSTSPLMLTTQRWKAECIGAGTGLAVYSPDGIRYDMTQLVTEVGGAYPVYAWYTTRITDRNNNYATVSYAANGSPQISSVSTSDSRSISFSYLDSGTASRRISSISANGHTWSYSYTAVSGVTGRYFLTQVTRPSSPTTSWRYAYNTVVSADNAANYQLRQMTYPQGGTVTYGYAYTYFDSVTNPASRSTVVASKSTSDGGSWSFSYAPGAVGALDTTTVSTPSGTITYRHFGANYATSGSVWRIGLLAEKRMGSIQTEQYEWDSQLISYENNLRQGAFPSRVDTEVNAPILTRRTIVRNGATYSTQYSNFDSYGNPQRIAETGPNGGSRTTNLTYYINTSLWIVRQVDDESIPNVGFITRGWNTRGNLTSENRDGVITTYTRTSEGDIASKTDPRGFSTQYSTYHRGIPQFETQPESVTIARVVSNAGNVTTERDGEFNTTTYVYDGLNRLIEIRPPRGAASVISYTANSRTVTRGKLSQTTSEDGFGRATSINTGGIVVAYRYDSLGRRTFESLKGHSTVGKSFQYDTLDRLTRITYADNSTRVHAHGAGTMSVTNERGHVTTYAYRAYGNPDKTYLMGITAPVAAANVSIARNGRDLVTSMAQGGMTRSFGYDARYYLTSATHPETGTTVYGRDAAGNMVTKRVGGSADTVYTYDQRNRLVRVTYPGGNPSTTEYFYMRTDLIASVYNGVAVRKYGYDANRNLTFEGIDIDGQRLEANYGYNDNDQLGSIVYPVLGRRNHILTDYLGRMTCVGFSLTSAPVNCSMAGISYWPNGQIYDIAFAGGSRATYGQNNREWLNSVTVRTGDGVTRVASTITHDRSGNVTAITDSVDAAYNRSFAYDAIHRLTTANGPWGNGSLGYDGRGNITSYTLGSEQRTYGYDPQNRLATFTRTGFASASYGYDVYGNAQPGGAGYVYDHASNLRSTASGQTNFYDGTNTRVKTVVGDVTTYEFRSAMGHLLAEWRKQPGYYDVLKEHVYVAGKRIAEQRTEFIPGGAQLQPSWMFLQPDALGSVVSSTWAGGGLLYKENYRPYGEQVSGAGNGYNRQWFTGQTQDASDLIYMGARYYNPMTGRFLSIDPKEADPQNLHSLNRYAYANNNPNGFVDPDGHSPIDVAFLVYDLANLGVALYSGQGVGDALVDVGLSIVGVASPVPGTGQALKAVKAADKVVDTAQAAKAVRPDFIVSSKGTAMPTNKDFNLVDSKKQGDWFQIHNTHTDAKAPGISHTHFPERHHQSTTREIKRTSGSDIDKADGLLRSGQMRERLNRGDKGGPLP